MGSNNPTAMDFYNAVNAELYLTDIFNWYRLPKSSDGTSVLVVSISAGDAQLWVVAYTILVTLIFMAACELATGMILTFFKTGDNGNRHAILVSYYNAGRPSKAMPLMFGYFKNALFGCRRNEKWSIDWSAVWASFALFLIGLSIISGDMVTRFFLGGKRLIEANVAQANPGVIYYPGVSLEFVSEQNEVDPVIVEALKGLQFAATYQAAARATNAKRNLQDRIQYSHKKIEDGDLLTDGSLQKGTGARFEYGYNITGYELGLRDAPSLLFKVQGSCATYHGVDAFAEEDSFVDAGTGRREDYDDYPYFGNPDWYAEVALARENFSAPYAEFLTEFGEQDLALNELYGGFTFLIVPHTAWRVSHAPKTESDPWYETEDNPNFNPQVHQNQNEWNSLYRVKRRRPPLQCTQNDTYTYNGQTVNHVKKLDQLQGLKLSPFVREVVFGREFGQPVFNKLLGSLPYGTLDSTAHFIPNQRRLDAPRASIERDFERLVDLSFVYSREVVRNAVLLFPSIHDPNEGLLHNGAADPITGIVPASNADILLESTQVAALSVLVLVTTPSVCVFLWLLVWFWGMKFNPESTFDNKSAKARHGLRRYGLQAIHLFRYLDEELSRKRKWSGRNTQTPFIRDLDAARDEKTAMPAAVLVQVPEPAVKIGEDGAPLKPIEPKVTEAKVDCASEYAKPKLLRFEGEPEPPGFLERVAIRVRKMVGAAEPTGEEYEVSMTRHWNPEVPRVPWRNIRENV